MKSLSSVIFILLFALQSMAQEKKLVLNFYTGVASFKTHITHLQGTDFKSADLYTIAPTGLSLSAELIRNTFIDVNFGAHSLRNDYLNVQGTNYGARVRSQPITARNFGFKLKYEINLPKSFKIIPFLGYSVSFIGQPVGTTSPFEIRSKSTSLSYVNGVAEEPKRDSLYSSTEFITNTFHGLSAGGELAFDFKNKVGIYFSYAFFYSSQYYAVQYGEYRSTSNPTQKATTSFGKNGQFYQIGIRYTVFNY